MSQDRIHRLQQFVEWSHQHITGDEKGQAQIFLDRLFQAFGQPGSLDVGGKPEFRIKPGKDDAAGTAFADYVWKQPGGGVLIEMKKRGIDLARTRQQAFDYWIKLVPHRPRYTILCNFDEFWIYDFNIDLEEPLDKLTLADLPKRYDPLAFLFPTNERPVFQNNRVEVTRQAADRLVTVFNEITTRTGDRPLAQRFALQSLVALFAEDINLLPRHFFTNLLADTSPEGSYDDIGGLFEAMNREKGTPAGRFKEIRYFNGGLFAQPARIALSDTELAHLREAAQQDWSKVSPDIFGTLFQHSMDQPERHAFGGHYTSHLDIMKIIKPTIVDPWTQLIDAANTAKKILDLLRRISLLRVLDPACGSGNFLYVAYRELKRLEARIRLRLRTEFPQTQAPFDHVNARQFFGMDINSFAIELAKVTMMLARKLAIDELEISDEPPLPLDNLDRNFICNDALRDITGPIPAGGMVVSPLQSESSYWMTAWPAADIIIGNPPFLGAKRLKPERGPDYINSLRELYPAVPGMADYCVYWFRRAHDHIPVCTPDRPEAGRAGLVGTQNIRNNQSRVGGLEYITDTGIIIEAVDNQPWSGEANVHVSIANWIKVVESNGTRSVREADGRIETVPTLPAQAKEPSPSRDAARLLIPVKKKLWFKVDSKLASNDRRTAKSDPVVTEGKSGRPLASKSYELDFRETPLINSALSDRADVSGALILTCNTLPQRVFQGNTPGHHGFVLTPQEAESIIQKNPPSKKVIFPYLVGREALSGDGTPERFLIDFDQLSIIEAQRAAGAFKHIEKHVLPEMQKRAQKEEALEKKQKTTDKSRRQHLQKWWRHWRDRAERVQAVRKMKRFLVCSRVTKRPIVFFIDSHIRPGDALQTFAFDDDYSFGILQSSSHWLWFITKCSKLKSDYRYTPESVFDTFPWPQFPTQRQVNTIAAAGRKIRQIRDEALRIIPGGLRALYRTFDLAGQNPLRDAHTALDAAVLAAYGFSHTDDLLIQLLLLNLEVAARIDAGKPVSGPGIPAAYSNPKDLITDDCIQQ